MSFKPVPGPAKATDTLRLGCAPARVVDGVTEKRATSSAARAEPAAAMPTASSATDMANGVDLLPFHLNSASL